MSAENGRRNDRRVFGQRDWAGWNPGYLLFYLPPPVTLLNWCLLYRTFYSHIGAQTLFFTSKDLWYIEMFLCDPSQLSCGVGIDSLLGIWLFLSCCQAHRVLSFAQIQRGGQCQVMGGLPVRDRSGETRFCHQPEGQDHWEMAGSLVFGKCLLNWISCLLLYKVWVPTPHKYYENEPRYVGIAIILVPKNFWFLFFLPLPSYMLKGLKVFWCTLYIRPCEKWEWIGLASFFKQVVSALPT